MGSGLRHSGPNFLCSGMRQADARKLQGGGGWRRAHCYHGNGSPHGAARPVQAPIGERRRLIPRG